MSSTQSVAAASTDAAPTDASAVPFQVLGYRDGHYYYLPSRSRQVVALRAQDHTKRHLWALARIEYWQNAFPGDQGPKWDQAANALIRACESRGVYDPSRIRGRGAWWDAHARQAVLHVGDAIITNGQRIPVLA